MYDFGEETVFDTFRATPCKDQATRIWTFAGHAIFLAAAKKDKGPAITLGFDAFNVPNRVNYMSYIGDLSSPFFGKPIASQPPRRLQLSFRFRF